MESIHNYLKDKRTDYGSDYLDLTKIVDDPFELFSAWLEMAISSGVNEPHAMLLSSVSDKGRPSSRVVLLRELSAAGLTFYTNYNSRKAAELAVHPLACLNFFWPEIEKQIRVEGVVQKVEPAVSDAYFNSRPRASQIGAWASHQSQHLGNRLELEQKVEFLTKQFEGKPVPRPDEWGGFCLKPDYFEFWQGRTSRLHDRIEYRFENNKWLISRLYP